VETERRLKALEAELQQAELAKKERGFALRYHKIKFFGTFSHPFLRKVVMRFPERQKVTRKLKQVKKGLEAEGNAAPEKKPSSELEDLRVDLNYILVHISPCFGIISH
jgi:hypothetical protein